LAIIRQKTLAGSSRKQYTDGKNMNQSDKTRDETAVFSDESSFEEVVSESLDRLRDRKAQRSLRHIRELEEQLDALELELDMLIPTD
jgi:histidyl-tRNA synthetase